MAFWHRDEYRPAGMLVYSASAVGVLGTAAMSPVLPVMLTGLDLTEAEVGLMMTLFTLPVIFSVPLVGWLADRVGRRPVFATSLVLFGLTGSTIFFVTDFTAILALRTLQGVAFGGVIPLGVVIVGDMFSGEAEIGAHGLRVTVVNAGATLFPVLMGALATIAWNVPFLLFAVAIPAGLLVVRHLPEAAGRPEPPERYTRAVLAAARKGFVAAALAAGGLRMFVVYSIYTYLPILVVANEISAVWAGLVVGVLNGTKTLAATQVRRSVTVGEPAVVMGAGVVLVGVGVAAFGLPSTLPVFVAVAALVGALDGVVSPLQKGVLTRHTARNVRGGVISFNAVVQNLAKTLAPVTVGVLIAGFGVRGAFPIAGSVVAALGLLVFVVVLQNRAPARG